MQQVQPALQQAPKGINSLKRQCHKILDPFILAKILPIYMNRQQQFREHFRFLKDICEKVSPRSCRRSKLEISNLAIEQIRKNEKVRETFLPVHYGHKKNILSQTTGFENFVTLSL